MANLLKLKDGKVLRISDPFLWNEIKNTYNHPGCPDDYEFKSPYSERTIKKTEIDCFLSDPTNEIQYKKKYYKIVTGTFNEISISEQELPKAVWSFNRGEGANFANGSCSEIKDILPDKIKTMGWNDGYYKGNKIHPDDVEDVNKTLGRSLEDFYTKTKELAYTAKNIRELESKILMLN